jgi:hypothetical protein
MSVRDLAGIGLMMLHGGKVSERAVVPADWVTRCITPVISADEIRRYGYQWFLLDIAFGKPKGWAVGRLERMWMAQGEGGQRLFINPACNLLLRCPLESRNGKSLRGRQRASSPSMIWIATWSPSTPRLMPGGKMSAFRLQRPGGRSRVLPKRRSFIDAVTGRPQRNFQRHTSGMNLAVAIRE